MNRLILLNQFIGQCKFPNFSLFLCMNTFFSNGLLELNGLFIFNIFRPKENSKKNSEVLYERKMICTCVKKINVSMNEWSIEIYHQMMNRTLMWSNKIHLRVFFFLLFFFLLFLDYYIYVYKCYRIIVVEQIIDNNQEEKFKRILTINDEKTSTSMIDEQQILSDDPQTKKNTCRTFNNTTLSKF